MPGVCPLGENVGIKLYIAFKLNSSIAEATIYNLLQFLSYMYSQYRIMDLVNRDTEIFSAIHNFIYWLTKFWSTKVTKIGSILRR